MLGGSPAKFAWWRWPVHRSRVKGLVQRVSRAAVRVGDECTGAIGAGLFALVGVGHDDGWREHAVESTYKILWIHC
jgi:D-Tyr-tRNAtyr deacylase